MKLAASHWAPVQLPTGHLCTPTAGDATERVGPAWPQLATLSLCGQIDGMPPEPGEVAGGLVATNSTTPHPMPAA